MEEKLRQLVARLREVGDLRAASAVLWWDQTTHMPPGGAAARSRQIATLERLAHEKLVDPAIGRLLDELQPHAERQPYASFEAGLVRVVRRDYEKAVRVPPAFVEQFKGHLAASYEAWARARASGDFGLVRPYLEKTLEFSRRMADFYPGYSHIADPLIDLEDPGVTAGMVQDLFRRLREQLVPLVRAIAARPPADDGCLRRFFPKARQWEFAREVIRRLGYDFTRGRLDKTLHPYQTTISLGDVRIAIRDEEEDLGEALFGAIHEAGHAMYEQGICADYDGTPLAEGTSAGVHESQSRLWENIVGRSRAFWRYFYPRIQAVFPGQLGAVPLEAFYRAINKVRPSLIRTSADEVTYDLHVIIRFDLELALLEGRLEVRDLPEAWRERYRADLGVTPPDDRDGVLQDMHWYDGFIGSSFQGYTLGNVMAAQFFQGALRAHPEIPAEMEQGFFGTLHSWLAEKIYRHGRLYEAPELVQLATGEPLRIEPYIGYLRAKFGELYEL